MILFLPDWMLFYMKYLHTHPHIKFLFLIYFLNKLRIWWKHCGSLSVSRTVLLYIKLWTSCPHCEPPLPAADDRSAVAVPPASSRGNLSPNVTPLILQTAAAAPSLSSTIIFCSIIHQHIPTHSGSVSGGLLSLDSSLCLKIRQGGRQGGDQKTKWMDGWMDG